MSLKNNDVQCQRFPRSWGIVYLGLMLLLCFCGSDQKKSKTNPQPTVSEGTPVEPPGDWDGLQDWNGSAFKILEE